MGLALFERSEALGAFDAVLAPAATGSDALVSADAAFAGLPDIKHAFPDAAGVAALIPGAA